MRRSILPLLMIVVVPLVALGCNGDDPYCYATDESGAVLDSVRPDPGYVCVASTSTSVSSAVGDSVRPDTAVSVKLQTVRRSDLR